MFFPNGPIQLNSDIIMKINDLDWLKLVKYLHRTKIEYSENNSDTVITKMFKIYTQNHFGLRESSHHCIILFKQSLSFCFLHPQPPVSSCSLWILVPQPDYKPTPAVEAQSQPWPRQESPRSLPFKSSAEVSRHKRASASPTLPAPPHGCKEAP